MSVHLSVTSNQWLYCLAVRELFTESCQPDVSFGKIGTVKGINEISPVFPTFSSNLDKVGTVYIHKNVFIYCGFCEKWWCSENHALPCFSHNWEVYIDFIDDFVEWRAVKVCCYTSCWLTLSVVCADHTQEALEMFLIAQESGCIYMYIYSPLSISVICEEFNKMYISYILLMPVKSNSKAKIIYMHWETDCPWSSVIYILILMPQPLLFNVRCHSWKVHWQKSAVNGLS